MVYVKYILFNNDSIYFFIFTTFAVCGLFYKIALAALLLDVFWRFPTLTNIVNVLILSIKFSLFGDQETKYFWC